MKLIMTTFSVSILSITASSIFYSAQIKASHSLTRCSNSCVIEYGDEFKVIKITDCCGGYVMSEWPKHYYKKEPAA